MKISTIENKVYVTTHDAKTIDDLAKFVVSTDYSLSTFKDSYRTKENFVQTKAIGLDFDAGLTIDEALKEFAPYEHIIAPTRSHQKEKNGVVCDRFRVILFLTAPIKDIDTFYATWFSLAEKWPASDKACKDPSRYFYPSRHILSINSKGLRIAPVAPQPKPVLEPVETTLADWDKGKLARSTMDLLEKGAEPGTRNPSVYKAARDFNQALYSEYDAMVQITNALTANGTIDDDFTFEEACAAISSAYASDPAHPPRIEPKAFKWQNIGQFMREAKSSDWIVDKLLTRGGMSIIAGPPKSGKSTIVRQLAKAISRGEPFFDRACKQGLVFHIALEEQEETLKEQYTAVGVTAKDAIYLHVGSVHEPEFMQDLRNDLERMSPTLLIVDTMFLLSPVESSNDYSQVNAALTPFRNLARATGTHIMFVHHTNKGGTGDAGSIAGSTAIHGSVDCALILSQWKKVRKLTTSQRGGISFDDQPLLFNYETQTYSLGTKASEDDY